jgi:hypothetical protein
MNSREAVKHTLKFLFEILEDERDITFTEEQIEKAAEAMHDNDTFFEELLDFLEEHIEMYGENYGLVCE